ncbi:cell division protein PerM [Actinomyces urinae]|uniref:cell division protein PerM n=1 Tax=Actinomyces urinae TaxID=1689268 RepID=UPI0011784F1A|nr:DUF6350 family protein [Actinomyces urinae]
MRENTGDRSERERAHRPSKKEREASERKLARKAHADQVRERVLEQRRRDQETGVSNPRRDAEELRRAIAQARSRQNRRAADPRAPHELPTERLTNVERALIEQDLLDELEATPSQDEIEEDMDGQVEQEPAQSLKETESEPAEQSDAVQTVARTPVERKVIVVRPPAGWPQLLLAALETAFFSWALIAAVALVSFLANASNPWMMEADWNSAISVGSDFWAMSYGASVKIAGASYKMIPLGLTIMHVALARAGLARASVASWRGSALFIPAYLGVVLLLALFNKTSASLPQLILGSLFVSALAWVWSLEPQDLDLESKPGVGPYLRAIKDAVAALAALFSVGMVTGLVGIIAGWSRIRGITDLLNASVFDSVIIWITQALYLPNVAGWAASWLMGPGFYTASDAIVTPSRADVAAIPAIPILGAIPQTEVGIWVVLIPIVLGVLLGVAAVKWRQEANLADHLVHASMYVLTLLVLVAAWMWLSMGSLGVARMGLLGPRLVYAVAFAALEVGLSAAVVYALAHPFFLAKYAQAGAALSHVTRSTSKKISRKTTSDDQIGQPDLAQEDSGDQEQPDPDVDQEVSLDQSETN